MTTVLPGPTEAMIYRESTGKDSKPLDFAQQEFPNELGNVSRDRISFRMITNIDGKHHTVRSAVIDLHIEPSSNLRNIEKAPPPQYLETLSPDRTSTAADETVNVVLEVFQLCARIQMKRCIASTSRICRM